MSNHIERLKSFLEGQKEVFFLQVPILFALGILFYNLASSPNYTTLVTAFLIFGVAVASHFIYKSSYQSLLFTAIAIFMAGYSYNLFFDQKLSKQNEINGKIYADIKGTAIDIREFYNPINKKFGTSVTLADLAIYKTLAKENSHKKTLKKPKKPKKIKKVKKKDQGNSEVKKTRKAKKAKKAKKPAYKITKKMREKWLNFDGLQEIDSEFLETKDGYQEINWIKDDGSNKMKHPNPPDKISISTFLVLENLNIGDSVEMTAFIIPNKNQQIVDGFDKKTYSKITKLAASGFATSAIKITKVQNSKYQERIQKLRKIIEGRMIDKDKLAESTIANALITGNSAPIPKEVMQDIRSSGLAHLISISGLHLALAAGIFFISIRLFLSRFEYLALRFDIRKIAAVIAIASSYFYLEIAGSPVPAQRSFIMVGLIFLAMLFDKKPNTMRFIAVAALVTLIINPNNLFSISFQLSFAAVTALIAFYQKTDFFPKTTSKNSFFKKILPYFIGLIASSIIAQVATLPFLIYHFNNFSLYGTLANIIAIPLCTFITMPLGFLSLFLMPFNIEFIALKPMYASISLMTDIAHYVANMQNSTINFIFLPKLGLALAIIGGLLMCFTKGRILAIIGLITFLSFPIPIFFNKKPSILIDGEAKFFAVYDQKDGLIFSKKLRESKKRDLWLQKLGEVKFKYFAEYPQEFWQKNAISCNKEKCLLGKSKYTNKTILILLQRGKIDDICQNNFDLLINLTAKYKIPSCVKKEKVLIDNSDLANKGTHFLYFADGGTKIRTAF